MVTRCTAILAAALTLACARAGAERHCIFCNEEAPCNHMSATHRKTVQTAQAMPQERSGFFSRFFGRRAPAYQQQAGSSSAYASEGDYEFYPDSQGYEQRCYAQARECLAKAMVTQYDPGVSAETPIELFLTERMGRFGNYTFGIYGGRPTQPTPLGTHRVRFKKLDQFSNRYKMPMPLSLFFTDQCAIHVGSLNRPSRGCVHVDWDTAAMLYRFARPGVTKVIAYE